MSAVCCTCAARLNFTNVCGWQIETAPPKPLQSPTAADISVTTFPEVWHNGCRLDGFSLLDSVSNSKRYRWSLGSQLYFYFLPMTQRATGEVKRTANDTMTETANMKGIYSGKKWKNKRMALVNTPRGDPSNLPSSPQTVNKYVRLRDESCLILSESSEVCFIEPLRAVTVFLGI